MACAALGVGFFYQDKFTIIEKQAVVMCSVWGCCLWRDLAPEGGLGLYYQCHKPQIIEVIPEMDGSKSGPSCGPESVL